MATLYAFGSGSCRGHGWSIRETMEVAEVVGVLKTAIQLRAISEEGYDEYIEGLYDGGERTDEVMAIVTGGGCIEEDCTLQAMNDRLLKLTTSIPFTVECEEYAFGVSETKDGATIAFAQINNSDDWD